MSSVMLDPVGESRQLVRDVLLRDGSTLRLLAPEPADFDDVKEFFDGLSLESRYMRFHDAGGVQGRRLRRAAPGLLW